MFKSSTKTTMDLPTGGPNTPLLRFSSLLSMTSFKSRGHKRSSNCGYQEQSSIAIISTKFYNQVRQGTLQQGVHGRTPLCVINMTVYYSPTGCESLGLLIPSSWTEPHLSHVGTGLSTEGHQHGCKLVSGQARL
jgi:hypothetical protein